MLVELLLPNHKINYHDDQIIFFVEASNIIPRAVGEHGEVTN